jgi:EAL domain-containing protein (putative c-di-GMP-specific phosphodiesterase class I)
MMPWNGSQPPETAVPPMPLPAVGDPNLLGDLRNATANGELGVFYQPIVRSADGEIVGFEALLRWDSPVHGSVSPMRLVPVAEAAQLMPQIGRWVLASAARQLAEWERTGLARGRFIHVNMTLQELLDPDLPAFAMKTLGRVGLSPEQLCLEMNEETLRAGDLQAEAAVDKMVACGFRPVLDDFGLDSSVEILTRFPFEFAKIDHGLIYGEGRPRHWARLLRGIGGLARSLNITLIVEGVEGREDMARVAALGFAHAQGYAFGRPESAGNLGRALAEASPWSDNRT